MWVILAIASALLLGCYDIFKKMSVASNNVLAVLFWNTFFCALLLSPFIVSDLATATPIFGGDPKAHLWILLKSAIVLASWTLGYFSIKHLPLTISGPISATRPVL
ncbi:MAG: EamA family transporter, partial [Muribaculaceae bacterium]|nr:EamA family transporter [Muribaculaceae bacterium]